MKNNKGFTLFELLVTVAILGIVTMMSFPLIRNISNSNDNSKYKSYLDSVVNGAKLYVDSYSIDMFGNQDTGCDFVTFDDLLSHNLVKDFDMNDITCNTSSTFVEVSKNGDKYTYKGYLGCTNKNNPGSLVYSLPNNGEENNPSSTCVNVTSTGTINFSLDNTPSSESLSSYALKKRTLKVILSGNAGISAGFNVYYGWSKDRTGSDISNENWKPLLFGHIPTIEQQKSKLKANQGPITTKSNFVDTPDGLTGSYYLLVRTNDLMDVYGVKWGGENGGDTFALGPFILDNEPPVFDTSSTVLSTASGYNNDTPKLAISVRDNYSTENELDMCVSYTGYCEPNENYSGNKKLTEPIPGFNYDGKTYKIYVTVMDLAGNIAQRTFDYLGYKLCTRTIQNGNWSGSCPACGRASVVQTRPLVDYYFGSSCGQATQTITCEHPDCCDNKVIVCGNYGSYSACTRACASGVHSRTRSCYYVSNYDHNVSCSGTVPTSYTTESTLCNLQPCTPYQRIEEDVNVSTSCSSYDTYISSDRNCTSVSSRSVSIDNKKIGSVSAYRYSQDNECYWLTYTAFSGVTRCDFITNEACEALGYRYIYFPGVYGKKLCSPTYGCSGAYLNNIVVN